MTDWQVAGTDDYWRIHPERAVAEIERLRAENSELRDKLSRAWQETELRSRNGCVK